MKIKRTLSALMITLMTALMLLTNVFAASNNRQYVMVSYLDPEMGGVETVVIEEDSRQPVEKGYSRLNFSGTEFYSKSNLNYVKDDGKTSVLVAQLQNARDYYPYSWTGTYADDMISATASDAAQATFVAGTLNNSMNTAISFILSSNGITGELTAKEMQDLVRLIPACKVAGQCGDVKIKGKKINLAIRNATDDEFQKNKINSSRITSPQKNDYITLIVNGKTLTTLWSIEKGYASGQYLYGLHEGEGDADSWSKNVKKLSLAHIAYSADQQFAARGETISDYYNSANGPIESTFSWLIMGLITQVTNGIKSGFNLYSIEDMMLGTGIRNSRYFLGIMPETWFSGAKFLFAISSAIAIGIIGFGILRLILQMNKAAINSQTRVDYKEGIYKLIATVILLLLFYPLFTLLANVNHWIVQGLAAIPSNTDAMSNLMTQQNSTWAGVVINICYLATLIKINVTYIIRSVTVGLLFAFGPLFIATLSTQDKAPIFWTWLKELIGNLFMQSIHAMVMVFYLLVISGTRMTGIEKVVIVMSLIPLTTFFKNTLLMLSSGTDKASESMGAKLFGAASFAMGAAAIIPGTAVNATAAGLSKLNSKDIKEGFAHWGLSSEKLDNALDEAANLGNNMLQHDIGDRFTGLTAGVMTMAGKTNDGFESQGANVFRKEFRFDKPNRKGGGELKPSASEQSHADRLAHGTYTYTDEKTGKTMEVRHGAIEQATEVQLPKGQLADYTKQGGLFYPTNEAGFKSKYNTEELDAYQAGRTYYDEVTDQRLYRDANGGEYLTEIEPVLCRTADREWISYAEYQEKKREAERIEGKKQREDLHRLNMEKTQLEIEKLKKE